MKLILFIFLLSLLIGCNTRRDITGRYSLDYMDIPKTTTLYYDEDGKYAAGVIGPTVFAVGYNNQYIIVKQHPHNNRKNTNYYIVPIYRQSTYGFKTGVAGPLTLEQFNEKRKELQISDSVKFTIVIEGLK